ncbi:hypothetical protein KAM472_41390 [Aeromonas caviae]|nr:hypothetical protein KAM450_44320 [Aeromonas caviae]GKR29822.1 hypothetical protein KAM469_42810 [Aeromonas caviae]GKR42443.1 hypothetical protein KAM472_41390 [Aeromonas caviae]
MHPGSSRRDPGPLCHPGTPRKEILMSLWLWIGLPLLFLLGLFLNAIKDMKQLEKQLPKYKDKIREVKDDEDD